MCCDRVIDVVGNDRPSKHDLKKHNDHREILKVYTVFISPVLSKRNCNLLVFKVLPSITVYL